jgi:hypothetical protein
MKTALLQLGHLLGQLGFWGLWAPGEKPLTEPSQHTPAGEPSRSAEGMSLMYDPSLGAFCCVEECQRQEVELVTIEGAVPRILLHVFKRDCTAISDMRRTLYELNV